MMPRTASAATFWKASVGRVDVGAALGDVADVALFFEAAKDRSDGRVFDRLVCFQLGADEFGGGVAVLPDDGHDLVFEVAEGRFLFLGHGWGLL